MFPVEGIPSSSPLTQGVARIGQSLGVNRSSAGGWFEGSKTFEYLRQLVPTFLEKLFAEMI
jgi:hypothetical protein